MARGSACAAGVVAGDGFPGHFLVRVGGPGGVMIDPFFHARVLDDAGLLSLLRRTQGPDATVQPEHLAPVGARAMVVRMLNNLRGIYGNHRDHARAMLACDRLYDLTDAPEFRRDRGLHAAALGLRDAALDDLRAYLAARPEASDAVTLRARVAELTAAATKRTLQ